jgi:hypothetical protein
MTKVYDLIFLVTSRDKSLIESFFNNMVDSYDDTIELLLFYVNQEVIINYESFDFEFDFLVIDTELVGLSSARNIGLDVLRENNISSRFIMFPDDDSTFDKTFFQKFNEVEFKSNINYITPIYNVGTFDTYIGYKDCNFKLLTEKNVAVVGSPNQILNYQSFKSLIYFDTKLGVGADYGSSEDHDLFYKLLQNGATYVYTEIVYSFHPKKTNNYQNVSLRKIIDRFSNYSKGFAYVNFKYGIYYHFPEYLYRTFLASIFFLIKLRLKLSFAYLIQFFIRVYFLLYFTVNRKLLK